MAVPEAPSVVEWSDIVLERKRLAATTAVTRQLLSDAKIEVSDVLGLATDTMVLRMESLVTVDPRGRAQRDVELVSPPVYTSWQAHRVATATGWRQRFLAWRYGIDLEKDVLAVRVKRGVHVEREAILPEHAHDLPGWGNMHVRVLTSAGRPYYEPAE